MRDVERTSADASAPADSLFPRAERLFPPAGFVDRAGACAFFGGIHAVTLGKWVREGKLARPRRVKGPGGKLQPIYAIQDLARARDERAAAQAALGALPQGYLDREGLCAMFGVTVVTWDKWARQGRVPRGEWGRSRTNKPMRIYKIAELEAVMREMHSPEKIYKITGVKGAVYHIPDGFVRQRPAARMFGVDHATFHRWEVEGKVTCGFRVNGSGPKLYPVEELKRMIEACGKYSPPYPDPARPGVWRVPLTGRDIHRREAIIDEADVQLLEGWTCHWSDRGHLGKPGQIKTWDGKRTLRLRQLILGVEGPAFRVGHRNGDPLDCRRENLFVRSKQDQSRGNGKNKGYGGKPCSSRFKGVCWVKRIERWSASIVVDGKSIDLGRFHDEIAAAQAYDEAARELFGEYARPNFPDGVDQWLDQNAADQEPSQRAAA